MGTVRNRDVMLSSLTQEMRLLLTCISIFVGNKYREKITIERYCEVDWELFIRLVDQHRLYPVVYHTLTTFARCSVPEPVLHRLRDRYEKNTLRGMKLAAELVSLMERMEQDGIFVVPLKGLPLAMQVYGDLALRHAGDLDLLVAFEQFELAEHVLFRAGYRRVYPDFALSPRQRSNFTRFEHHFGYYHGNRQIKIELHYRCFNDPRLFPLNIDQVLKEQRFLTIAGRQVQTLTIEDTILYLCVHGSLHAWFRLFWLCDIAEILEKSDTIDWVWLMTRAAEMRVKRFLVYGLVISNLLLSSPLPASMVAYVDQDKGVFTLIQMALRIMNGPEDLPYRPFSYPYILEKLYELKLCSNLRYKFFVCLRYLNTIPYDWQAVPLPDSLFPLYYILRPFLWFWRWCAK